jgi:hypothetical protein
MSGWAPQVMNSQDQLFYLTDHRVLVNDLPVLLEQVLLHQRKHMRFMHDGTPSHFLGTLRQRLNQTSGEEWRGRGGQVNWPTRSSVLNPPPGYRNT